MSKSVLMTGTPSLMWQEIHLHTLMNTRGFTVWVLTVASSPDVNRFTVDCGHCATKKAEELPAHRVSASILCWCDWWPGVPPVEELVDNILPLRLLLLTAVAVWKVERAGNVVHCSLYMKLILESSWNTWTFVRAHKYRRSQRFVPYIMDY